MRQKLSQIHKNLRKQMKAEYFRQRREELLLYREQQALQNCQNNELDSSHYERYGWRGIVLQKHLPIEEQKFEEKGERSKSEIDFEINLRTIQDGEYYLNVILEEVNIRCFEATIYLLGRLTSKLLKPIRHLGYLQQKNQTNLVYMILTHTNNLLQTHTASDLLLKKYKKNKMYLLKLFAEDYKGLLNREDPIIINQLISISQIICNEYQIPPNYELIKYVLLRIATRENLHNFSQSMDSVKKKIENLLINFIIHCKIEERSILKQMNIPHQQIIYDFNTYIEFNLINIYDFIKNNHHPFDYDFINDSLSFVLTLQIQIINKFRKLALADQREEYEGDYLLRESVINVLEKIIMARQEKDLNSKDLNETAVVLEQTVTVILWYLLDCKVQRGKILLKKLCLEAEQEANMLIEDNSSILSMILLIKVKLRELSSAYD